MGNHGFTHAERQESSLSPGPRSGNPNRRRARSTVGWLRACSTTVASVDRRRAAHGGRDDRGAFPDSDPP